MWNVATPQTAQRECCLANGTLMIYELEDFSYAQQCDVCLSRVLKQQKQLCRGFPTASWLDNSMSKTKVSLILGA